MSGRSTTNVRAAILGILLTMAVVSGTGAATPIDPKMPADFVSLLGIKVAPAGTLMADDARNRAITAAKDWLHRVDAPLTVFPAIGSRYVDDPQIDVLVVVWSGGQFLGGPPGIDKSPASNQAEYSGVLIVPSTGEVLRSFEIGRAG